MLICILDSRVETGGIERQKSFFGDLVAPAVVIKYVKRCINQNAKFSLWGRSMGAVTGKSTFIQLLGMYL